MTDGIVYAQDFKLNLKIIILITLQNFHWRTDVIIQQLLLPKYDFV